MGELVLAVRHRICRGSFRRRRDRPFDFSGTAGRFDVWSGDSCCQTQHSDLVGLDLCRFVASGLLSAVYGATGTRDSAGTEFRSVDSDLVRRTGTIPSAVDAGPRLVGLGTVRSACLVWLVPVVAVGCG